MSWGGTEDVARYLRRRDSATTAEIAAHVHADDTDAGVYVDTLTNERCLLHVAATRAKRYLMARPLVVE